jgi:hypothetical protein
VVLLDVTGRLSEAYDHDDDLRHLARWQGVETMEAVSVKVMPDDYSGFVDPPGFSESGSRVIEAGEGTAGIDKSMPIVVARPDRRRRGFWSIEQPRDLPLIVNSQDDGAHCPENV